MFFKKNMMMVECPERPASQAEAAARAVQVTGGGRAGPVMQQGRVRQVGATDNRKQTKG